MMVDTTWTQEYAARWASGLIQSCLFRGGVCYTVLRCVTLCYAHSQDLEVKHSDEESCPHEKMPPTVSIQTTIAQLALPLRLPPCPGPLDLPLLLPTPPYPLPTTTSPYPLPPTYPLPTTTSHYPLPPTHYPLPLPPTLPPPHALPHSPWNLSLNWFNNDNKLGGGDSILTNGYSAVTDYLTGLVTKNGGKVLTNHPVTRVKWDSKGDVTVRVIPASKSSCQ